MNYSAARKRGRRGDTKDEAAYRSRRKRAGSGKGAKRSFGKGLATGVLGSIGAAVIGKLFNRDEKEVEEMVEEGGGRFGRDELEKLMNGGFTGKGMPEADVTRHPEGPNAHGGEPEYQEGERPFFHDQLDTHPGDTDPLIREIDEKIVSLQKKVADAKKEAADVGKKTKQETKTPASGGTPDEAKAQIDEAYGGTPAEAEAQINRAEASRAAAAPARKPQGGAPLSALTPDRPQTGQGSTEQERFMAGAMPDHPAKYPLSMLSTEREGGYGHVATPQMEQARSALFGGGNGGGDQGGRMDIPMPSGYREEMLAKLPEEQKQRFLNLSPEEQQAQINEMWKQYTSGTAGGVDSPWDWWKFPAKAAGAGVAAGVAAYGGKKISDKMTGLGPKTRLPRDLSISELARQQAATY